MKQTLAIAALLLASASASTREPHTLESKRLDTAHLSIVCTNGADPTGFKVGKMLVISCVDERR